MNKNNVLFSILILAGLLVQAQPKPHCHTSEYIEKLVAQHPELIQERQQIEQEAKRWSPTNKAAGLITIPVVVHVIYNEDEQNISDAQIQSQIRVLNEDFSRTNADRLKTPSDFQGVGTDTEIRFCLAQVDPDGNPTSGITRTFTTEQQIGDIGGFKYYQTAQGGHDIWDRDAYLNIWVCETANDVLGFATPPSLSTNADKDGVVIGWQYFGFGGTALAPNDRGRTTTHEVGHWLGLEHLWGSGNAGGSYCTVDDNIADTPNQEDANYFCPSFPHLSCSNGPAGDMFMNYMDYTDDACMNLFTLGQKNRMLAILNSNPRKNLFNSNGGCSYTGLSEVSQEKHISISPNPTHGLVRIDGLPASDTPWQLSLYNAMGQLAHQVELDNKHIAAFLPTAVKTGLYLVAIENGKTIFVQKLYVER